MKKTIILLFLGISFVMMVLISYLKFQASFHTQTSETTSRYQMDKPYLMGTEYDLIIGP